MVSTITLAENRLITECPDTGCKDAGVSSCLDCPLPKCTADMTVLEINQLRDWRVAQGLPIEGQMSRTRRRLVQRNALIVTTVNTEQVPIKEVARRLGLSRALVYQVLQRWDWLYDSPIRREENTDANR